MTRYLPTSKERKNEEITLDRSVERLNDTHILLVKNIIICQENRRDKTFDKNTLMKKETL